jgi:hypothetical protein
MQNVLSPVMDSPGWLAVMLCDSPNGAASTEVADALKQMSR